MEDWFHYSSVGKFGLVNWTTSRPTWNYHFRLEPAKQPLIFIYLSWRRSAFARLRVRSQGNAWWPSPLFPPPTTPLTRATSCNEGRLWDETNWNALLVTASLHLPTKSLAVQPNNHLLFYSAVKWAAYANSVGIIILDSDGSCKTQMCNATIVMRAI